MRATTRFRQLLERPGIIVAPGAYDCLSAALIERAGFDAVYMTGAGTSIARLGAPDLGLATADDMTRNAGAIAGAVDIPLISDADTGYGGVLNIQRVIREYERVGAAAIHLEDQVSPKRCGHLDNKEVVSTEDMARKIRAAVDARTDPDFTIIARTDALAVTGWEDTIERGQAFVEAGADVLFVEALRSREDVERAAASFNAPLLYNYVESGRSPLLTASELEEIGYKIVIFPASGMLSAIKAIEITLDELKSTGATHKADGRMVTLHDAFELVGMSDMLARDAHYS